MGFKILKKDKGTFTTFQAGRTTAQCYNCIWIAEADGLHGFMPEPPILLFKWSK
ncbi:hypothetical protein IGI04_034037 [Brassica rapa subsp. trilocularis]|uniref:Uncharacterized protein n=1 Tax=Brassica rapa subsp. trilocularis TaxID=1813537 RepID=A0ABQ7L7L4_BRACM|nr:hypothetical protein IGI04_034037 [Brassica rapa subsp. trilocularis]